MLVLQEEKSQVKVSDAKDQQYAKLGPSNPAEAVDKIVQGSEAIPLTDVTDSVKRQATELRTEYETQKKKLKMDNLAQQELKGNKEKLSKEVRITEHRTTAPDLEGGKSRERKRKIDNLMEQARSLEAQIETANNNSAHLRKNMREIEVALKRAERDWLPFLEQKWRLEKKIRIHDQMVKGVQEQLGQVKRQICELKNEELKEAAINNAVQREFLCDDCRYC